MQHLSDDDFDELQVVIAHLFGDYLDKINKFALHFMHQDGLEIYNDKLRLNFYFFVAFENSRRYLKVHLFNQEGSFSCLHF